MPTLKLLVAAVLLILLVGCVRVQPWEREHLADPIMDFEDEQSDLFNDEIAEIREASALGKEGTGGGCGCN